MAIIAVIGHHYWYQHRFENDALAAIFLMGWTGVLLFFGISGYLLGGQLMDGAHRLKIFYLRRVARIVPLYLVLLIMVSFFATVPLVFFVMAQNVHYAITGWTGPAWLAPTWSLAVEEQFYLILPLIILLVSRANLFWVLLAGIVASLALREWMWAHGFVTEEFVLLPTNLCWLFSGVLLAWLVRYPGWKMWRVPCGPVLGWIGRRSYGLYLFHLPAADLALHFIHNSLIAPLAAFAVLAVIVEILYRTIERPVLRLAHDYSPMQPATR